MFKSKDEAYLKPPSLKSKSCILGIGNGSLLILLLNPLKSEMKQTVPFFLGTINVSAALIHNLSNVISTGTCSPQCY